jgi:hypothetical protein
MVLDISCLTDWTEPLSEICACGHSVEKHPNKICNAKSTCRCNQMRPLFMVRRPDLFVFDQEFSTSGHALIQGVLAHQSIGLTPYLSKKDLGRIPTCYQCHRTTACLMPIIMTIRSGRRAHHIFEGRMTRLWCRNCVEDDGFTYDPTIEIVIQEGLRLRRLGM